MSPQRRTGGAGGARGGRRGEYSRKYTPRRKVCAFCVDKISYIDYKDVARLRRYLSERAKIEPRRRTGTCAKHQRGLATALKRARHVALLPFTAEHIRMSGIVLRSPDDRRRDFDRGRPPGGDGRGAPVGDRPAPAPAPDGAAPSEAPAGDGVAAQADAPPTRDQAPVPTETPVEPVAADRPETAPSETPADELPASSPQATIPEDARPVTAGD